MTDYKTETLAERERRLNARYPWIGWILLAVAVLTFGAAIRACAL